jgi:hypothetical protein
MSEELSVGIGRIGQPFAGLAIRDRAIELELNEFGDLSIQPLRPPALHRVTGSRHASGDCSRSIRLDDASARQLASAMEGL